MSAALSWLVGSRTGGIVLAISLLFGGLYAWHSLDKSSAVRAAVVGYVADVELAAKEAELKRVQDRVAALEVANFQFQIRMQEAEALQERQAQELEDYVSTVDAVVDGALLERLRNR